MKTVITLFSALLIFSFSLSGQTVKETKEGKEGKEAKENKEAPANVKSAFSKKFPTATKVEWGNENNKEWEAEFMFNNIKYSANFDNEGKWTETEYEISTKDIPAAVKTTLDKESAGYKIEESVVTETAELKAFEFVIAKGKDKMELVIDQSGKLVKKEVVEEEEEDEKN
jgi:hypothetical protein